MHKHTWLRQLLLESLLCILDQIVPMPSSTHLTKTAKYRPFPGRCSFCMRDFMYLKRFPHDFTTPGRGVRGTRTFNGMAGYTFPELRSAGEHCSFRPLWLRSRQCFLIMTQVRRKTRGASIRVLTLLQRALCGLSRSPGCHWVL